MGPVSRRKAVDHHLSVVPSLEAPAVDLVAPPRAAARAPQPEPGLFELNVVVDDAADPTSSSPPIADAGPLPEGITTADIRREMVELGAPADVLATAETFGED